MDFGIKNNVDETGLVSTDFKNTQSLQTLTTIIRSYTKINKDINDSLSKFEHLMVNESVVTELHDNFNNIKNIIKKSDEYNKKLNENIYTINEYNKNGQRQAIETYKTFNKYIRVPEHLHYLFSDYDDNAYDPQDLPFPYGDIYKKLWDHYNNEDKFSWRETKIETKNDYAAFVDLNNDCRNAILTIMKFFAKADVIIGKYLDHSLLSVIKLTAFEHIKRFEAMMEDTHTRTYFKNIDALVRTHEEKESLLRSVETDPVIKKKADWAMKWIPYNPNYTVEDVLKTLLVKMCIEYINFSTSFCFIDMMLVLNIPVPGIRFSNEEISRDENFHVITSMLMFLLIVDAEPNKKNPMSKDVAYGIIKECVETEELFVDVLIPVGGIKNTITRDSMRQHIKHYANIIANNLKYSNINDSSTWVYPSVKEGPFAFMNNRNLNVVANFFEIQNAQYAKAHDNIESGPFTPSKEF